MGIGRWLRAAGYDVAIAAGGAHDDDLLAHACAESRPLLTCDRRLAGRAGADPAIGVLATENLDEAARELSIGFGIDWLPAPFTRCLVDNTRLAPAATEEVAGLPLTAREGAGPIMRCPRCRRVFWQSRAPDARQAGAMAERGRNPAPLTQVGISHSGPVVHSYVWRVADRRWSGIACSDDCWLKRRNPISGLDHSGLTLCSARCS